MPLLLFCSSQVRTPLADCCCLSRRELSRICCHAFAHTSAAPWSVWPRTVAQAREDMCATHSAPSSLALPLTRSHPTAAACLDFVWQPPLSRRCTRLRSRTAPAWPSRCVRYLRAPHGVSRVLVVVVHDLRPQPSRRVPNFQHPRDAAAW